MFLDHRIQATPDTRLANNCCQMSPDRRGHHIHPLADQFGNFFTNIFCNSESVLRSQSNENVFLSLKRVCLLSCTEKVEKCVRKKGIFFCFSRWSQANSAKKERSDAKVGWHGSSGGGAQAPLSSSMGCCWCSSATIISCF